MRTIIAGSRDITDIELVSQAVSEAKAFGIDIGMIISGKARGVDTLAIEYAILNHIDYTTFPADWDRYGKSAGYRRNQVMAEFASATFSGALIAIWDGKSKGTKHMIDIAKATGLKIYVKRIQ